MIGRRLNPDNGKNGQKKGNKEPKWRDIPIAEEFRSTKKENKKDSKVFIVQELSKVIGIGKSQAERLIKEHSIKSIDDLLDKYNKKKIKVSHKIDKGLKYFNKVKKAIPQSEMKSIDTLLTKEVPKVDADLTVIVCGSYRRGKDKSNDIDVLVTHKKINTQKQFNKAVEKKNYLQDIVAHLKTVKRSNAKFMVDDLDLDYTTKYNGFCRLGKKPIRRIDIRFMPHDSYHTALLYYTGSGDFNKQMRLTAKKKGYKLSEYSLCEYKEKDGKKICQDFKIKSEKDTLADTFVEAIKNRIINKSNKSK